MSASFSLFRHDIDLFPGLTTPEECVCTYSKFACLRTAGTYHVRLRSSEQPVSGGTAVKE